MVRTYTALTNMAALFFAVACLPSTSLAAAAPIHSEEAACERVKTRVSAVEHFPASEVAFCDPIDADASPRGFYVLSLHSNRRCDGICSTLMGWFAVEKKTGRVFDWDVAEMKLGQPLKSNR